MEKKYRSVLFKLKKNTFKIKLNQFIIILTYVFKINLSISTN